MWNLVILFWCVLENDVCSYLAYYIQTFLKWFSLFWTRYTINQADQMINTDFDDGIKYHKRHMQIIPVSVSLFLWCKLCYNFRYASNHWKLSIVGFKFVFVKSVMICYVLNLATCFVQNAACQKKSYKLQLLSYLEIILSSRWNIILKKKVQLVKCMLTHRDMEKKYTKTHNSASSAHSSWWIHLTSIRWAADWYLTIMQCIDKPTNTYLGMHLPLPLQ